LKKDRLNKNNDILHGRHVPERTCMVCRQKKPKRELVRIVRDAEGHITVDTMGRQSGRGAYLCHNIKCWQQASKESRENRLAYALRTVVSSEDRAVISEYGRLNYRCMEMEEKVTG
jgi:hypothetical protein